MVKAISPRMIASRREERLLELLKEKETDGARILAELRLKEPKELMALAYKVCAENNLVPPKIDFGLTAPSKKVSRKKIDMDMNILLSRQSLECLGFKAGESFVGRIEGDNIILEKEG